MISVENAEVRVALGNHLDERAHGGALSFVQRGGVCLRVHGFSRVACGFLLRREVCSVRNERQRMGGLQALLSLSWRVAFSCSALGN